MTGGIWFHARWLLAAIASLAGQVSTAHAQGPANSCSLTGVARLPLTDNAGWFTTTAIINDHPTVMLIDTGAGRSAISPTLAAQLRLPQDRHEKVVVNGVGGEREAAHLMVAHSFQLGDGHWADYRLALANVSSPARQRMPDAPEGALGLDLLSDFDLEFDFPNRTLTLYTPNNCSGNYVPWSGHFDVIQGKRQFDGQLFIPVRLNKEAINAVIDTGSTFSSIGIDTAHDVGVLDKELQADRFTNFYGVKGTPVPSHLHVFDSLEVGQDTYRQAPLFISDDRYGVTQMLLGMDFFRQRKVWISFRTEQVFFQPGVAAQK